MYMRGTRARALQKRTSVGTPLWTVERRVAALTAAAASPRTRTVEPRPSVMKAAMVERPGRGRWGIGEHVNMWFSGREAHRARGLVTAAHLSTS